MPKYMYNYYWFLILLVYESNVTLNYYHLYTPFRDRWLQYMDSGFKWLVIVYLLLLYYFICEVKFVFFFSVFGLESNTAFYKSVLNFLGQIANVFCQCKLLGLCIKDQFGLSDIVHVILSWPTSPPLILLRKTL